MFVLLLGRALPGRSCGALRRSGTAWPAGRIVAFCGLGLGFVVIATMSWVGVYQPVLFYVRAVQTILLLLVVPLFLALGRPLTLAIAALPRLGPRIEAGDPQPDGQGPHLPRDHHPGPGRSSPFVVYFTPWYAAGLPQRRGGGS